MRAAILGLLSTSVGVGLVVAPPAMACTNFLVSKGASTDGSTFITYSADSHTFYGALAYVPPAEHPPGAMRDVFEGDTGDYLGQIPEVPKTFAVVGNMNEHQVAIGETTFGGREELVDPVGGVDYGSLMVLALQRAKSAREAIQVIGKLTAEHGYRSEGESLSISDPNGVWIMEIVGKGPGGKGAVWVARRVPDGFISAHANQARIRQFPRSDPANCLYSPDVISFAREKGYFRGTDAEFSFADTYAPMTFEALRFCEARVWAMFRRAAPSVKLSSDYVRGVEGAKPLPLWIKPDKKLSVHDVMELMRDHFEDTELDLSKGIGAGPYGLPYRWRPLTWKSDKVEYVNERATSTQQTGYSFVAQARAHLPNPIGGVLWFGVDDTYSTVYVPMYCGIHKAPKSFAVGTGSFLQFSWDSAFWLFNAVANFAYSRYQEMIKDVRKAQAELEGTFLAQQAETERTALKLHQTGPDLAREFLTKYSAAQAEATQLRWRKLWEELQVKYVDGNLKDEHGKVSHPGYSEEWYRRIAQEKERGELLRVRRLRSEPEPYTPVAVAGYFHGREELGPLAKEVPADFPFAAEKLLLVAGTAKCGQPPHCCLAATPDAKGERLVVAVPEAPPEKCGHPAWLLRLGKNEVRQVVTKKDKH